MLFKHANANRSIRRSMGIRSVGAMALAAVMLATGIPAAAANVGGKTVAASENVSDSNTESASTASPLSVVDVNKNPRQLNVHVGDDAATQVNVTYTTVADTTTMITLNKKGDQEKMYVEGSSYQGIGGKYIHEISVTGLEADTQYEYTVGDGFNNYSGTFKTALEKNDDTAFTFAYLADTQVSNGTNAKALGATLAKVNEMNVDFVYLAGDMTDTNNSEAQWEWLFNNDGAYPSGGEDMFASNLVVVTQGNHDNNEMYQHINAPEEAGKIVYSFDYGCAKFIILNLESARYSEDAREEQAAYLREAVADARENGQWTIVGFHKSLYTGASHIVDSDIIAARKYWSPIFAELDVDLVLQGHDHVYSRGFVTAEGQKADRTVDENGVILKPDNAPLYMVGGHAGGLKWYSRKNYTVSEGDPLALNYSFLDVNSTDTGSDIKKEQVIVTLHVTEDQIDVVTTNFKYNTDSDSITTDPYVYDSFSVKRNTAKYANAYINGTDILVKENDGDTLEYTVSYNNIVNANAFETAVSYDESQLELVSAESCLDNTIFTDVKTENGVSDVMTGVQNAFESEAQKDIVKYTFRLKDGVDADEVTVKLIKAYTVQVKEDGENITSEDITANIVKAEATTILYSYEKASDINKDGIVTLADLSIALAYYQTSEEKCDINRDGVVNALDYVIIASYIR